MADQKIVLTTDGARVTYIRRGVRFPNGDIWWEEEVGSGRVPLGSGSVTGQTDFYLPGVVSSSSARSFEVFAARWAERLKGMGVDADPPVVVSQTVTLVLGEVQ